MSSFFFAFSTKRGVAHFDEHEVRHLKVMRFFPNDEVKFTDGKGNLYSGKLITPDTALVLERLESQPSPPLNLSVVLSPVKWDRTKFAVEKAVELGATRIFLWNTERTTRKKTETKLMKSSFVARDAMKQCGSFYLPSVEEFEGLDFSEFSTKIFLEPGSPKKMDEIGISENVLVVIGPEGGFSEHEKRFLKEVGFDDVRLGNRILRSETAVIASLTLINYLKGVF